MHHSPEPLIGQFSSKIKTAAEVAHRGGAGAAFKRTRFTKDSVVFENPEYDFPKIIRDTRKHDGHLVASIAAPGSG